MLFIQIIIFIDRFIISTTNTTTTFVVFIIGAAILVAKGPVADKWKLTYKQTTSIKAVRGSGISITHLKIT